MQRRKFIQIVSTLTGAAAMGIHPVPAHAKRKPKIENASLRGYCVNNEWVPLNMMLSPQWGLIGWGAWLRGQWAYRDGFKWAIALYDGDFSSPDGFPMNDENMYGDETHFGVLTHPHYDGWWILLREPDLNNSVEEAAATVNEQISMILRFDPQAKFCVSIGTAQNPVYRDNSYGKGLWGAIGPQWKPYIKAKGVTYYPYDQAPQLQKFLKQTGEWKPERELWVLEYGLVKGAPPAVTIDGETPFTVTSARAAMGACGVARDAWYPMQAKGQPAEAYEGLLDANEHITATGAEWLGT